MNKTIDRARLLKISSAAGIAAFLSSVDSIASAEPRRRSPMNLTLKSTPAKKGSGICYTIVVGEKPTVPARADVIFQVHADALAIDVQGNGDWNPEPKTGKTKDQWITIYALSCT